MTNQKNLWLITRGQRLRYSGAIVAMALTNVFMFGAPLVGMYAIDVVNDGDLGPGLPLLTDLTSALAGDASVMTYLWLSALASVVGIEIQVRLVEEPHLRALHGKAFDAYTSRVGRFLPGVGRQRAR